MKRLWYPTEDDVNMARIAIYITVPIILVVSLVITFLIPRVSVIGMNVALALFALVMLLRGLVMIRGASTLPIEEADIEKYKAISKQYRQVCKTVGVILPFASTLLLLFKRDLFPFGFGVSAIFSTIFLGLSGIASTVFVYVVIVLSTVSVILLAPESGVIEALQLVVIAWGIVTPHTFRILIKMRKATENTT
jgi:hypothetical protein